MNIIKFEEFKNDQLFEAILIDIFKINEKDSKWLNNNTIEWDLSDTGNEFEWDLTKGSDNVIISKLKSLLSGLSKEKIRNYFSKFIKKIKFLPEISRKKMIATYASVFLSFVSLDYLFSDNSIENVDNIKSEFVNLNFDNLLINKIQKKEIKSNFEDAQGMVKTVEAGYSHDRGDRGNWYRGRFIGTNHGISAPVLAKYLGRIPSKTDMINLKYETALEIYKNDYWDDQELGEFNNQSISNIIYDGCVNQGIAGMKNIFRKVLNKFGIEISDNDNPFEYQWINKANKLDHEQLFNEIKLGRETRYREARTFRRHGDGWLKRLGNIKFGKN